jgi:hypothetical protein
VPFLLQTNKADSGLSDAFERVGQGSHRKLKIENGKMNTYAIKKMPTLETQKIKKKATVCSAFRK